MIDDGGDARLVRAGRLLAECWWRFRFGNGTEEIADHLAEAERLYDSFTDQTPGDVESAATVAIGRSTVAAFALRLCVDVEHGLNGGWDWDHEGPPLGEMEEWDEDGVSAAAAERAVRVARAALDADPDDPLVPLQLGQALAWIGDRDGAVAAYAEALRRDPWDGAAGECLGMLDVDPPKPPPADPVSRRRYGFAALRVEDRVTNSEWFEQRRLYGSLAAARADADAAVRDDEGLERELLEHTLRLELEVRLPGRPVTTYDLISRVPDHPDVGPFAIDWSGVPVDEPLEPPLPPGRVLRMDGMPCFYAATAPAP
ncbi:hypothetical protein GCM10009678_02550 [Actinomadura kijaniata]|uniref:Tetratricopeptide (TPR) repeat protein n=1 Tax=Actinomadura namibiensis TaxID=182080 RepID=A0A7W3LTT2_ACTNM|nr:hypothetical protein [Actinomadura namibiensis]MBA8954173.1 tetratricopeptide (TPR) repeat protein [Actinomadura namibiensis]